jgi:formylglycine-generating enzyme required for sulfatase activity
MRQGSWHQEEWVALLAELEGSAFWPMDPEAVRACLERHRETVLSRREAESVCAENLRRWLRSGEPRFWVIARKARWGDGEWRTLLKELERSDFWPMDRRAVGSLLEELKRSWRKPGDTIRNALGMRLAWIPPGQFIQGSPPGEEGRGKGETRHSVTLTRGFFLSVSPVTQASWKEVMGHNPSHFPGDTRPVESVTWEQCQEFCRRLSRREDRRYRLPTEAEWEYACRAGTAKAYFFGDSAAEHVKIPYLDIPLMQWRDILGKYACYQESSGGTTRPVGTRAGNAWGLRDMHGNVWEWTQDWYDGEDYGTTALIDPQGPGSGKWRAYRGGCWGSKASRCRSAQRPDREPKDLSRHGFRVVLEGDDRWSNSE